MKVNSTLVKLVSSSADSFILERAIGSDKMFFDLEHATGPLADRLRKYIGNKQPRILQYKNSAHASVRDMIKEQNLSVPTIGEEELVYGVTLDVGYQETTADGTVLFRRVSKGPNPVEAAAINSFGDDVMIDPHGKVTTHWRPTLHWCTRLIRFGKNMVSTMRTREVSDGFFDMKQRLHLKGNASMRTVIESPGLIVITDTGSNPEMTQTALRVCAVSDMVISSISTKSLEPDTFTYSLQVGKDDQLEIYKNNELYFAARLTTERN